MYERSKIIGVYLSLRILIFLTCETVTCDIFSVQHTVAVPRGTLSAVGYSVEKVVWM